MMDSFLPRPGELEALRLSLKVAVWAVGVTLPMGISIAWILARVNFPGKTLLDVVIHLPLVLPPVVVGYVLLVLLGRRGFLGGLLYATLGITFAFNWQGAAVAAGVVAFPLMVRAIRLSIESLDQGLESAARTLGAGRTRVFFTITVPLITPGIIAGSVLAFVRSIGEFGATITFVGNIPGETRTLPLALYTLTQVPGGEHDAFRLCVISVAISVIALMASELMAKRVVSKIKG